ncbi:hypothetical protein VU04_01755 [Desulfobulbus sp. TB]|nr:hypothetical protein [Desulfobulbus sp. TB]
MEKEGRTEITFMLDIPDQPDPWNNEYTLTVSTYYTEHGTLRTPLNAELGIDTGILIVLSPFFYATMSDFSLLLKFGMYTIKSIETADYI